MIVKKTILGRDPKISSHIFFYNHGRFLNPINGAWEFNFETDVVMSSEEVVREEIVSEVWLKYNILI